LIPTDDDLEKFIKVLEDIWDPNQTGEIKYYDLISNFISLGLVLDHETCDWMLECFFLKEKRSGMPINVKSLSTILWGKNTKINKLIHILNWEIWLDKQHLINQETAKKLRIHYMNKKLGLYFKQKHKHMEEVPS